MRATSRGRAAELRLTVTRPVLTEICDARPYKNQGTFGQWSEQLQLKSWLDSTDYLVLVNLLWEQPPSPLHGAVRVHPSNIHVLTLLTLFLQDVHP